ncbi:HEAT repeat domain-containing protein [Geobacter sp.]|uniref:HEAT repeat domain-containing protein n=1 Tax=Geobacter sp. TaxID=46610 RepID=UPI001AC854CB|nr:HEAT repeat domain-containing protein [Geobacter sp.]CAG0969887.1 hypothetical protein GEOBC_01212 [Geobacteraceae bacterium]
MVKRVEQHCSGNDGAPRRRGAALTELHRAHKVMGFYPAGHPLRAESLRLAFSALHDAIGEEPLLLVVGKGGFTSSDGGAAVEDNPMAQSLARELFIRRVRRLAFLPDLSSGDLEAFLALLSLDHRSVPSAGGMEALMARRGITTIWANEIDLSAIGRKRQEIEEIRAGSSGPSFAEDLPDGGAFLDSSGRADAGSLLSTVPMEETRGERAGEEGDLGPEELIALMAREPDDERYREFARAFVKECHRLQAGGEFERLLPLLDLLLRQANDGGEGLARRGSALLAFDQAAGEDMVDFLVQRLEAMHGTEDDRLLPLLAQLGSRAAVPLVASLCGAEGTRALRNLAAGLVAVGEEGAPLLVELLADGRGHVVQMVAAILGEIGHGGCVAELRRCLGHPDERVRREALRSLGRIGGPDATEAIIDCLGAAGDPVLRRQAAVSLGALRSVRAVEPLFAVVAERDLFLRTLPLKKDALAAIGRIGDRSAVSSLVALLGRRPLFFRRRWEELQCLAAAVVGLIGDPATLPLLAGLEAAGGRLGTACGAAARAIEQRQNGASHG